MSINQLIFENTKIDSGVGELNINLTGDKDNYEISTNTGIGSIYLNGEKCQNNQKYGSGNTKIEINGGIGSTNIIIK